MYADNQHRIFGRFSEFLLNFISFYVIQFFIKPLWVLMGFDFTGWFMGVCRWYSLGLGRYPWDPYGIVGVCGWYSLGFRRVSLGSYSIVVGLGWVSNWFGVGFKLV